MRLPPSLLFSAGTEEIPEQFRTPLEHQRQRDLLLRQRPGILFYPIVWFSVGVVATILHPSSEKALWLIGIGVCMVLAGVIRYFLVSRTSRLLAATGESSNLLLYLGLGLTSLVWGITAALSLLDTPLSEHFILIITGTLAICAGGAISLGISRSMLTTFLIGMLAPGILVSFFGPSSQVKELGLLLIVFAAVMLWITNLSRREYEGAVIANLKLAQKTKELTHMTTTDGLTGVNNRRYFEQVFESELRRAVRLGYPFSLLMMDLDHFKMINDQYGHLVGDTCLIHAAETMQKAVKRSGDLLARYGGEEFVVILPGMHTEEARKVAENIRRAIQETAVGDKFEPIHMTISIGGVSCVPNMESTPSQIITHADRALYKAKNEGRNRVEWSSFDADRREGDIQSA